MESIIFYGGTVLTLDETRPRAEAVLVSDGIIRAVGGRELLAAAPAGARRVNLEGAALLPAFLDSHSHLTSLAATMGCADLTGSGSFEEIEERLRRFIERTQPKPGQWVMAFGYDHNTLAEGRHPVKEVLDRVSPAHPLLITHASGHMGVASSAALQSLGLSADTPDMPGGVLGRAEDGSLSGYLEERAFTQAAARIPQPKQESRLRFLQQAQQVYLRSGITTIQDGFTGPDEMELLAKAAKSGLLQADVVCYVDLEGHRELAKRYPRYVQKYHNHLKIGGYKIFLDGSPQGRTAWLSRPYKDAADGYRGYPIHEDEQVARLAEAALRDRMQLLTHCNGDAAAGQLLQAYALAKAKVPNAPDLRPVMIHAQLLRLDQLAQLKELGMIASFFVAHTYYWGDVHRNNLGQERAALISPARSALEAGVPVTFHQDTPVIEPDMLRTIWCAMCRTTRSGEVLGPSERVSALQALRAVTGGAAYQYFEENQKGALTPGRRADFVFLDRNPLDCPPDEIPAIRVLRTIKDGRVVYEKISSN